MDFLIVIFLGFFIGLIAKTPHRPSAPPQSSNQIIESSYPAIAAR